MMLRNLLSSVPFVLLSLRAPDTEAAPAGGAAPNEDADPAWAPGNAAPAIEGESLETKNTSALGIIGTLFKNLGLALADFKKVSGEKNALETQFNALKETAQTEKDEHARTKGLLETEKDEHGKTRGDLDKSKKSVERLESLCDLRGIDKTSVVPPNPSTAGATPNEKANEYLALKAKEARGEVKPGTAHKFYRKNKKDCDSAEQAE